MSSSALAPTAVKHFLLAARPATLSAAIAPVVAASGAAYAVTHHLTWAVAACALMVSLLVQIGANYANDYSDFRRGADGATRVGPARASAGGLIAPRQVLWATWISFALAALAAVYPLTLHPPLALLGVACILAAFLYTGGPWPYGYHALGEVAVFLFFGLAAVAGTFYAETGAVDGLALEVAAGTGLLTVAILVANNLRDLAEDSRSGKRTLAVLGGDGATRRLYLGCLAGAGVACLAASLAPRGSPYALLALVSGVLAWSPVRAVLAGAQGTELIAVLKVTSLLLLAYALLLAIGLAL